MLSPERVTEVISMATLGIPRCRPSPGSSLLSCSPAQSRPCWDPDICVQMGPDSTCGWGWPGFLQSPGRPEEAARSPVLQSPENGALSVPGDPELRPSEFTPQAHSGPCGRSVGLPVLQMRLTLVVGRGPAWDRLTHLDLGLVGGRSCGGCLWGTRA